MRPYRMDPEPGANAAALRASGHVGGDIEACVDVPNALMVDAEDSEVLGLYRAHVGFVGNGQRATFQIVFTSSVEGRERRVGARIVALTNVGSSIILLDEVDRAVKNKSYPSEAAHHLVAPLLQAS